MKISRLQISIISLIITTIILSLKFLAYLSTGSAALKSDALESVVNLVSAAFTIGAVIFAERPADESHPYGHGKIEYFSAAFEGGLISLAAILIMYEAVKAFFVGHQPHELNQGLLLNVSAGALNGLLGWWLITAGRSNKSTAIVADGHHVLSDFYTTIALTTGLLIVKLTGLYWLDPVLAGIMGIILAMTGFKLVSESSNALLDKEDPSLIRKLLESMEKKRTDDIINVHGIRSLRSGRHTHVDIHVTAPEFYSLEKSHDLVAAFGKSVLHDLNLEGEFHTHIDPCRREFCENCAVSPCPIRRSPFSQNLPLLH